MPEADKLSALWRSLEVADRPTATLNDAVTSIATALKDFANDRKLQKALTTYIEEHGNDKVEAVVNHEEKIVSEILEEKVEVKP